MKTGCFLKFIIFSTIVLAVLFYIVTNKYEDYIAKPIKSYLVDLGKKDIIEKMKDVDFGVPKDSVIKFLEVAGERIVNVPGFDSNSYKPFVEALSLYLGDGKLTKEEFEKSKLLFNEIIQNEERKKN